MTIGDLHAQRRTAPRNPRAFAQRRAGPGAGPCEAVSHVSDHDSQGPRVAASSGIAGTDAWRGAANSHRSTAGSDAAREGAAAQAGEAAHRGGGGEDDPAGAGDHSRFGDDYDGDCERVPRDSEPDDYYKRNKYCDRAGRQQCRGDFDRWNVAEEFVFAGGAAGGRIAAEAKRGHAFFGGGWIRRWIRT